MPGHHLQCAAASGGVRNPDEMKVPAGGQCRPAHPPGRIHVVLVRQPAGYSAEGREAQRYVRDERFFSERTVGVSNRSEATAAVGCVGTRKIRLTWSATVWDLSGTAAGCSCRVAADVSAATGVSRRCRYRRMFGGLVTGPSELSRTARLVRRPAGTARICEPPRAARRRVSSPRDDAGGGRTRDRGGKGRSKGPGDPGEVGAE